MEKESDIAYRLYIALGTVLNDAEYINEDNHLIRLHKQKHLDEAMLALEEYGKRYHSD